MTLLSIFSAQRSRGVVVLAAAAVLAISAGSGAVAGSLITGADIKDRSIEVQDLAADSVNGGKIKDNSVKLDHLNKEVTAKLGVAGKDGTQGRPQRQGRRRQGRRPGKDGARPAQGRRHRRSHTAPTACSARSTAR